MPSTDRYCCAQVEESSTPVEHSVQAEQSSQVDQNATQIKRSYVQVLKSKPVEQSKSSDCRVEPAVTSATSGDPLHRAASPLPVEPQPHSSSASAHSDSGPALRRSSRAAAATSTFQQRGAPTPPLRGDYRAHNALARASADRSNTQTETPSLPAGSAASSLSDNDDSSSIPSTEHGGHACFHPQCGKFFTRANDRVKHLNDAHRGEDFPLPENYTRCPICSGIYHRNGITNHRRRMHPGQPAARRPPAQRPPPPPPASTEEANHDFFHQPNPLLPHHLSTAPPDIDTLHDFYRLELTWTHAKWKPLFQQLHLRLLQRMNSTDTVIADDSFSAYSMLPGFIEVIRIVHRLAGAKQLRIESPISYLRTFTAVEHTEHPEQVILATTRALHSRVRHSLASRSHPLPHGKSKALSKVCALTQIGRISKAARLADSLERSDNSDSDIPMTQVTRASALAALPELFPLASELDDLGDRIDDEWESGRPLQVTAMDVAHSITKLSIDRAAGSSGWSNRLLKQLYLGCDPDEQQLLAENYAKFFNAILKGRLSERVRGYLTNVRLCLIPKSNSPSDIKYRPIGVGETIFRLLGRTILNKVGKDIGDKIAPHQLAVGIPGGVEIAASMAGMLDAINDSQPFEDRRFAMLSIDIKNAFNSIRRSFVLQGLRRYCPSLIPLFTTVYGRPVNLKWNDGSTIGTASTGVIQGDPLSTLYFAVGIQPLLLDLQRRLRNIESDDALPQYYRPGLLFSIADDITILARKAKLASNSRPD